VSSSLQDQLQTALGGAHILERELGGGGMSRVFLALETALGRQVVVKVLLPELAAGVNVERFRREIQLAAQLQHPHIVPLLSAGEAEGLPYFIMPYVTGESLRARMAREGELPISETVRIMRDIVSALAYAHTRGVVHRDVKPDNVLLSGGVAVVTDFGVAKAVTASSDIAGAGGVTSLGVVTYEMLVGQAPFSGRSPQAVLAAQVVEDPPPVERRRPAVPPMLASLVNECLAKRPADRPQSAAEIMHVLDAIATPSGGTAPTVAVRVRDIRGAGARRWPWYVALAAVAVIVVGSVVLFRPAPPGPAASLGGPTPATPAPAIPAPTPEVVAPAADSAGAPPPADSAPPPVRRPAAHPSRPTRRAAGGAGVPAVPPVEADRFHPDSALPTPAAPHIRTTEPSADTARRDSAARDSAPPTAPVPAPAPVRPAPRPAAPPPPAPPPVPADPRPAIQGIVADYAAAVESESLTGLRRLYPTMSAAQAQGWEQFFNLVRDVKAELAISSLDVVNGTAEAQVAGTYTYLNTSTQRGERQPVSFHATFRRDGDRWRLLQIR
jgi:serine/threonine-protein kinase